MREHGGAVGLDVLVESLVGDGSFLYNPIVQAPQNRPARDDPLNPWRRSSWNSEHDNDTIRIVSVLTALATLITAENCLRGRLRSEISSRVHSLQGSREPELWISVRAFVSIRTT